MKRRALRLLLAAAFVLAPMAGATPASAAGCAAPVGTANLPGDPEPSVPIWCVASLGAAPQTGAPDGFGGWVDSFASGVSGSAPAHLSNENGYTTQESISPGGTSRSQHFEANGYFAVDLAKTGTFNGSDLSPNQSVRFQGGKLVLEADVAASVQGFSDSNGGDVAWPEMVWSTTQRLNPDATNDALYSYGYYRGFTAAGCRLQAHRSLTCAVEADHVLASTTNDQPPCFSSPPSRVMELSGFQTCGSTHSGFAVDFGAPSAAWRVCPAGTVDPCLDRFRLEWSKTGLKAWVNGIPFAEDSGWPAGSQLPDAIVNGSVPIWAHFADWGDFSDGNVYRFHWQRIAVNPHDAAGSPLGPSASPTFGTPPPPTPSPTPTGTPTPTPAPTPFPCTLTGAGATLTGTCLRQTDGSIRFARP